ncbi:MAG: hypothetical protein Q9222_006675, partial [Ikaeria aurantiellina]
MFVSVSKRLLLGKKLPKYAGGRHSPKAIEVPSTDEPRSFSITKATLRRPKWIVERPIVADDVQSSLYPHGDVPVVRQVRIHGTKNAPEGWISQDEKRARALRSRAARIDLVASSDPPNEPVHPDVDPLRPYRLHTRYPRKPKIRRIDAKNRRVFRYSGGIRLDLGNDIRKPDDNILGTTEELLSRWSEGSRPRRRRPSPRTTASSHLDPSINYRTQSFQDVEVEEGGESDQSSSKAASLSKSTSDNNEIQAQEEDYDRGPQQSPLGNGVLWSPLQSNSRVNGHDIGISKQSGLAGWPPTRLKMQELRPRIPTEYARSSVARLHTSSTRLQALSTSSKGPSDASHLPPIQEVGVHEHLRLWQQQKDREKRESLGQHSEPLENPSATRNTISQSSDDGSEKVSDDTLHGETDDMDLVHASDVDQEGETEDHNFLQPGDVVDYSTSSDSMLAVFIRNIGAQSQFYSVQGKWFHRPSRWILFSIQGLVPPHELEPLIPYLPDGEIDPSALDQLQVMDINVPREVGVNLISKLQAYQRESAEVYREHLERFDRAHPLLAEKSTKRMLSLSEVAMIILQKQSESELTDVMLWTVHKRLVKDIKFRPMAPRFHRTNPFWVVNPTDQIHEFEQVQIWLREYLEGLIAQATSSQASSDEPYELDINQSNPTPRFIEKVKGIIKHSRSNRKVTAHSTIGPSSQQTRKARFGRDSLVDISPLSDFDPMERMIIDYLATWCVTFSIRTIGGTWSLGSMLLRSIGMYEGHELDVQAGSLLLRELGVIAPWESRILYDPHLRLPSRHDEETKQLLHSINVSMEAMDDSGEKLKDSLEGIRKGWGNMPVYCIDSALAKEIDDGISLEKVEGQDSVYWVHAHIANPSAFIKPDSLAARYAETLFETIYLHEKMFPMISPRLSQRYFSLANNRPVLTFSAKLAHDGSILETQITPGWIRNVKQLTLGTVGAVLGFQQDPSLDNSTVLRVGQPVEREKTAPSEDPLSSQEKSELKILHELGTARRLKRGSGGELQKGFSGSIPDPYVYIQPNGFGRTLSSNQARQFYGDPFISWEAREVDATGELATDNAAVFVGDIMLLAGEVAALWCSERNIPIIYRGTVRNPSQSTTPEAYKADIIDPAVKEKGYAPAMYYRIYNQLLGNSALRSHPFPHAIIGSKAYAKVTSPLRRYPD